MQNRNPKPKSQSIASRLPITRGEKVGSGHFYLAQNRTFLLCVDKTRAALVQRGSSSSAKIALQTATHSSQMHAWIALSDGFLITFLTSSCRLLQNEHFKPRGSCFRKNLNFQGTREFYHSCCQFKKAAPPIWEPLSKLSAPTHQTRASTLSSSALRAAWYPRAAQRSHPSP